MLAQRLVLLLMLLVSSIGAVGLASAQDADEPGDLIVADVTAETLYVYNLRDFSLAGRLDGVAVAGHAGFLPLSDGRLLFVNDVTSELVLLAAGESGPEIVGSAPVPSSISHFAVDPAATMAVVGSGEAGAEITLVDLDTFTSESFAIAAGEVGILLGGDPLTVFHRNDEAQRIESYPVDQLAAGNTSPAGTVAIGAAGHGEAISHDRGRLYLATDDGFEIVEIGEDGLEHAGVLPWESGDRGGGRAYFARMGPDGDHLFSYIADRSAPESEWETWQNDIYIADLAADTVTRTELAPGYVFRFALSPINAIFVSLHPDGDNAIIVDADPDSVSFGQITATIPLDPLSDAPEAGAAPWEHESRTTALTPDGRFGFISHGGDGLISVIDMSAGSVIEQIEVPTPLSGGGAMIALAPGTPLADTIGR